MGKIILYHGTQNKIVTPVFGGGNDKHDYGRGFYLTEVLNLAKEWAVCVPNSENGWVHKYELDCTGFSRERCTELVSGAYETSGCGRFKKI